MNYSRFVLLASVLALTAGCKPKGGDAAGTATTDARPAVAVVNGEKISASVFDTYTKAAAGKAAADLTSEQRDRALDNLVRVELVAQQAQKDGITKEPQTAGMLELARLNVLQQAVSESYLKDKRPTEKELRTEYEAQVAALPRLEYHARHILVATEQFAEKLVGELDKGSDFTALAKRESMDDGSKASGGDLNWFTPDGMVKPFADAVIALKPGQYTHTPVKTQYGWHVIKLEDTREVAAPPFDQVKQRLEQMVLANKFKAHTDELLKTAKVEKTAVPAPAATTAAPGATPVAPAKPSGG